MKSEKHYSFVSFGTMALLSALAVVIAMNSSSLKQMILIVFSISVGVAPVYVLRWFWLRINAWSQISAMITSCLCSLVFHLIHQKFPGTVRTTYFDEFSVQMLISTAFTTFIWLIVTFITPKDEEKTLHRFASILPEKSKILYGFTIAFLVGVVLLLLNLIAVSFLLS